MLISPDDLQRCKAFATQADRKYDERLDDWGKGTNKNGTVMSKLAELAFCRWAQSQARDFPEPDFTIYTNGVADPGYDFIYHGTRFEIKAQRADLRDKLRVRWLDRLPLPSAEHRHNFDVVILALVSTTEVELVGWTTKERIAAQPLEAAVQRNTLNRCIHITELYEL